MTNNFILFLFLFYLFSNSIDKLHLYCKFLCIFMHFYAHFNSFILTFLFLFLCIFLYDLLDLSHIQNSKKVFHTYINTYIQTDLSSIESCFPTKNTYYKRLLAVIYLWTKKPVCFRCSKLRSIACRILFYSKLKEMIMNIVD